MVWKRVRNKTGGGGGERECRVPASCTNSHDTAYLLHFPNSPTQHLAVFFQKCGYRFILILPSFFAFKEKHDNGLCCVSGCEWKKKVEPTHHVLPWYGNVSVTAMTMAPWLGLDEEGAAEAGGQAGWQ